MNRTPTEAAAAVPTAVGADRQAGVAVNRISTRTAAREGITSTTLRISCSHRTPDAFEQTDLCSDFC